MNAFKLINESIAHQSSSTGLLIKEPVVHSEVIRPIELITTMAAPITIAISGCSSSGKTTLMYLLEHLLSTAFTLQQDEFQNEDLPLQANGTPDAERVDSVDMVAFERAVRISKETGAMPAGFKSWQDPKDIEAARQKAIDALSESEKTAIRKRLLTAIGPHKVGIMEGLLLYQDSSLLACADIRLFLRTRKATAKARRLSRPGYGDPNTKDFWRTDAYFDDAVWPKYVKESSFLFEKSDVEGMPNKAICELMGVRVQPSIDSSIPDTLRWAVDTICNVTEEEP